MQSFTIPVHISIDVKVTVSADRATIISSTRDEAAGEFNAQRDELAALAEAAVVLNEAVVFVPKEPAGAGNEF